MEALPYPARLGKTPERVSSLCTFRFLWETDCIYTSKYRILQTHIQYTFNNPSAHSKRKYSEDKTTLYGHSRYPRAIPANLSLKELIVTNEINFRPSYKPRFPTNESRRKSRPTQELGLPFSDLHMVHNGIFVAIIAAPQRGNGHLLAYTPSRWKNQPRLMRVGVHSHPLWLYLPSRGVRSRCLDERACRYTTPISTLPLYVLCEQRSGRAEGVRLPLALIRYCTVHPVPTRVPTTNLLRSQ
jgi:hypothetical protein